MQISRILLFTIFIFILNAPAPAKMSLTLDQAIQIGLENSYEIKQAKSELKEYQHALRAWKLRYSSNANIEASAPVFTKRFRDVIDPATGKIHIIREENVSYRSSLIINQPILFTDGTLSLYNSLYKLQQKDENTYQSDIILNFNQPLFKTSTRKIDLKRAEFYLNKSTVNYHKQKRELKYNITEKFLRLFRAKKNHEITLEAEKRALEAFDLATAKFNTGVSSEMELLKSEVDALNERNNLLTIKQYFTQLLEEFKLYIGLERAEQINIIHSLEIDSIRISETELRTQAIRNHPDRVISEIDIKLAELDIKRSQAERQFTIDMNLEYGFSQIRNSWRKLFENPEMTQIANICFNIPLWDSGQNKESVLSAQEQLIRFEITLKQFLEALKVEIKEIFLSLQISRQSLNISHTAELKARKSYGYSVLQFNTGSITTDELALARIRVNRASLNNLDAKIQYLLAVELIKMHLTELVK